MQTNTKTNPESIAFALITCYPKWYQGKLKNLTDTDKIRGDLALEFTRKAKRKGHQVVIADRVSSKSFREELSRIGITVISRKVPERGPGKRLAIQKAATLKGIKIIIKTEPEKVNLVEKSIPAITLPIIKGQADIVVPKRERKLFIQSYPNYMHHSEDLWNSKYNSLLHKAKLLPYDQTLDVSFGPLVIRNNPEIISLFMETYTFIGREEDAYPEESSNAQMFPIVKALFLGLRVVSLEVPFTYPKLQKENESTDLEGLKTKFIAKRVRQRRWAITELIHYIHLLSPNSKIRKTSKLKLKSDFL